MSQTNTQERPVVTMTETAATVIKDACTRSKVEHAVLHVSVETREDDVVHTIALRTEAAPNAVVFEQHAVTMSVEPSQVALLQGTKIDYVANEGGGAFMVSNPNVQAGD